MKTSQKLKIIKDFLGLTQEKLARELDVSFATLNSWMNERSIPHSQKQERINALFKKYTGQKIILDDILSAKKDIIKIKKKKHKNIPTRTKSL